MPNFKLNKQNKEFSARLIDLLARHNQPRRGAGVYLAKRYQVSNVVANAWLNGEYKPEVATVKEIARDHGESFELLYFGESSRDCWVEVTGYSQAMGLGTSGPEAHEHTETHKLKFRTESLARKRLNPEALAIMYGQGDSMEPRIESGDAIMFDLSDTIPRNNGVYVIYTMGINGGEYNVKRCLIDKSKRVCFVADNPSGDHDWKEPRYVDDPSFPIHIVGRVKWIGGWIK